MADQDFSGDLMNQPSFAAPGAGAFNGITGEQHPMADDASYEGQYGSLLRSYDQALSAKKEAASAAQTAAATTADAANTAVQRHKVVMTEQQRRMQGALGQPSQDTSRPQGALPGNQPPKSLQSYLNEHDDDTFYEAADAAQKRYGQHPADIYDQMIKDKFISPADQDLTKRQKAEAFMHMGVELLKHSTHKAGQEDIPGAIGAALGAGQESVQQSRQQVAEQAHQEYLREQGLQLDKAKSAQQEEKDSYTEARQQAIEKDKNAEDWRKTQFTQGQENAREAARLQEEAKKRQSESASKAGEKNAQVMTSADGYQLQHDPKTNHWIPSLDADGNKIKTEKVQEFGAKQGSAWEKERDAYVQKQKGSFTTAYDDKGNKKTDDQLSAEFEKQHPKPGDSGTKTIQFNDWK